MSAPRPGRSAPLFALLLASLAACDRVEPPAPAAPSSSARRSPQEPLRPALMAVARASERLAAGCQFDQIRVAGPINKGAPDDLFSQAKPCLREACAVQPADVEALRARVSEARAQLAASEGARTASVEGALAVADATLRLIAIAQMTGADKINGLTRHHAELTRAMTALYPDAPVAERPGSLAASLAAAHVDESCQRDLKLDCKGYQATPLEPPQWQSDPPCLRVELKKAR